MTTAHHLAQFNIARLKRPRQAPEMANYNAALERVMPTALAWPGFLWIMDDDIVTLAERHLGQDIAANLSLWRDFEALEGFMTCPPHAAAMASREDWFHPPAGETLVLWWVPKGHRPDFEEALERLQKLEQVGPSAEAFTLEVRFPPPQ